MAKIPLIVDLDRTLVKGDTYFRDLIYSLFFSPPHFFKSLLSYVINEKGNAKEIVAKVRFNKEFEYKFNPQLKDFLFQNHQVKWLVSGAHMLHAKKAMTQTKFFEQVIASTADEHYSVPNKINWLKKNRVSSFDYAGDRFGDRHIFKLAKKAYIVNPSLLLVLWLKYSRFKFFKAFDVPWYYRWLI